MSPDSPLPRIRSLCVFCASSSVVPPAYAEAAATLGELIGRRGLTLVYGAGNIGLMGILGPAVRRHGGRTVGVIPRFMQARGLADPEADELVVTEDMRQRKAAMEARADAFLTMPGGFGTLEEALEILTLKQLHRHEKPFVLLNTAGFFDPLLALFERLYTERFTKPEYRALYHVAAQPADAMAYLDGH